MSEHVNENAEDAERNLRDALAYQFGSWDDAGPVADAISWLIEAKIAAALAALSDSPAAP